MYYYMRILIICTEQEARLAGDRQTEEPIFPENGGHGMMFRDVEGELKFTLHFPNDKYKERPMFAKLCLKGGTLKLDK